jgi:hypothetical protein
MIKPHDLEKAHVYMDKARKIALERTGLTIRQFNYLMIANRLNDIEGSFTKTGIQSFIGKNHYARITEAINAMVALGYIKMVKNKNFYSRPGFTVTESAVFTITGKTTYLVRKYTDTLRNYIYSDKDNPRYADTDNNTIGD